MERRAMTQRYIDLRLMSLQVDTKAQHANPSITEASSSSSSAAAAAAASVRPVLLQDQEFELLLEIGNHDRWRPAKTDGHQFCTLLLQVDTSLFFKIDNFIAYSLMRL